MTFLSPSIGAQADLRILTWTISSNNMASSRIICIGLLANTCIEATARFGMELGYHVTLLKDATAALSEEAMHAAHYIDGPTYAHEILTTAELREALACAT
ncbi:nicotinamidase-related amidase [Bradyrhizobium sp. AZCC 2262]